MNVNEYTAELVQLCADAGIYAEPINTGGGCCAVEVDYGSAGYILVTDGDADLPSFEYGALVGDYPAALDGDSGYMRELPAGTTPAEVATVIYSMLHEG